MKEEALVIHEIRVNNSKYLEERILKELTYVGFEKSRMKIRVTRQDDFNEKGFDDVCFIFQQILENH